MDSLSTDSSSTRKRLKISTVNRRYNSVKNNITTIAALPDEIQTLIVNKLDMVDFHRFSAVCRQWQSIAVAANKFRHQFLLKPQFPWLMLSFSDLGYPHHHGFFSLLHDKVFRLELPKIRGARCCGSNWGWLIMLGNHEGCMFLLNPFTRIRVDLPPKSILLGLEFIPREFEPNPNYIRKVMLLSPPAANNSNLDYQNNTTGDISSPLPSVAAEDDCLVVAIYASRHLAFCRPGDLAWTTLTKSFVEPKSLGYEDLIVYERKLYAIKNNYDLTFVELSPQPAKETSCNIAPPMELSPSTCYVTPVTETEDEFKSLYLVECCGELLVVGRYQALDAEFKSGFFRYDRFRLRTFTFRIHKLDIQHRRWIRVEDLGDQILFIGTSTGVSLSALDYPGFRGNSIYFTDDYFHNYVVLSPPPKREFPCHDLGVFHLEDNSIVPFFLK